MCSTGLVLAGADELAGLIIHTRVAEPRLDSMTHAAQCGGATGAVGTKSWLSTATRLTQPASHRKAYRLFRRVELATR